MDLDRYPQTKQEAIRRIKISERALSHGSLPLKYVEAYTRDLAMSRDALAWMRGRSELNGDYMKFIIPGEDLPPISNNFSRTYKKAREDRIKYDLAVYYRYSKSMLNTKIKICKTLRQSVNNMAEGFARYGKLVSFQIKTREGTLTVRYKDMLFLEYVLERFTKEFLYIVKARRLRYPFGAMYPGNCLGVYERIIVDQRMVMWMTNEEELKDFRNYLGDYFEDILLGQGMGTLHLVDSIFRICFLGRTRPVKDEVTNKVQYMYKTTDGMRSILGAPELISVLGLRGFLKKFISKEPYDIVEVKGLIRRMYTKRNQINYLNYKDVDVDELSELTDNVEKFADIAYEPYLRLAKIKAEQKRAKNKRKY